MFLLIYKPIVLTIAIHAVTNYEGWLISQEKAKTPIATYGAIQSQTVATAYWR